MESQARHALLLLSAGVFLGVFDSPGRACDWVDSTPCCAPGKTATTGRVGPGYDDPLGEEPLASVAIFGFQFLPQRIVVPTNARVGWTNFDSSLHTATSLDMPAVWDSGFLAESQSYTFEFSTMIREYDYYCVAHPDMLGIVEVRLPGDATGDDSVNISDFSILASNFNMSPRTYSQGDFNLNGTVEIGDFAILAVNFNTSAGSRGSAVPEPVFALPSVVLTSLAAGRRRSAC